MKDPKRDNAGLLPVSLPFPLSLPSSFLLLTHNSCRTSDHCIHIPDGKNEAWQKTKSKSPLGTPYAMGRPKKKRKEKKDAQTMVYHLFLSVLRVKYALQRCEWLGKKKNQRTFMICKIISLSIHFDWNITNHAHSFMYYCHSRVE